MKRFLLEILVVIAMISVFIVVAFTTVAAITLAYLFINGQL